MAYNIVLLLRKNNTVHNPWTFGINQGKQRRGGKEKGPVQKITQSDFLDSPLAIKEMVKGCKKRQSKGNKV